MNFLIVACYLAASLIFLIIFLAYPHLSPPRNFLAGNEKTPNCDEPQEPLSVPSSLISKAHQYQKNDAS
jgi:hypothetical protein